MYKILLFAFILLIYSNPICSTNSQALLPLKIGITQLSYPPIVTIHDEDDPINLHVRYALDVKYDLENPNDEAVIVWMGMCYSLPFYHINATFEEDGLRILYGHGAYTMVCSQSFEPGLKTNQSSRIYFEIDSYKEEELPLGFYTIWIDINYDDVFYPTIVSHAYMNITEENVMIRIECGDNTKYYPRETEFSFIFVIIPVLVMSCLGLHKRKRKNKKYFI